MVLLVFASLCYLFMMSSVVGECIGMKQLPGTLRSFGVCDVACLGLCRSFPAVSILIAVFAMGVFVLELFVYSYRSLINILHQNCTCEFSPISVCFL